MFEGEVNGQVCRSGNGQYYAIRFTNILSAFVALCFGIGKFQNLIKIEIVFENKFDFSFNQLQYHLSISTSWLLCFRLCCFNSVRRENYGKYFASTQQEVKRKGITQILKREMFWNGLEKFFVLEYMKTWIENLY